MKPRVANIDSLNFSSSNLEMLVKNKDYRIETVKSIGIFEPYRWKEEFKKPLARNIVEAKILHTHKGLALPIKRFSSSQTKQTLEFAGLKGYNEKSKSLTELLKELWNTIQDEVITRIDIAIDFKGKVPSKVKTLLTKKRIPFRYLNTLYNKTVKEKKTNPNIDIKIYNKALFANLDYELERLEFCFKGSYLRGQYQVKDIEVLYTKMQKTIKRFTGLNIEILPFKVSL